ncbi:MAG: 4'-phosphopantetheinyl transferase superfamily protein, partial [Oceanococcaceae bacterium]
FREQGEDAFAVDWQVTDAAGRLLVDIEDWCDRRFTVTPQFTHWRSHPQQAWLSDAIVLPGMPVVARWLPPQPAGFWEQGGEVWLRVAAHLMLDATERAAFYQQPATTRGDWLRGRVVAKEAVRALAQQWGQDIVAADIAIETAASGAPQVRCPALVQPVTVSITHHGGEAAAVAAAAELRVGVDLLTGGTLDADSLSGTVLSLRERAQWMAAPADEQQRLMIRAWTAREAGAKAAGTGLEGRPDLWRLDADIIHGPRGERAQVHWMDTPNAGCLAIATAPRHFMERKRA